MEKESHHRQSQMTINSCLATTMESIQDFAIKDKIKQMQGTEGIDQVKELVNIFINKSKLKNCNSFQLNINHMTLMHWQAAMTV